MSGVSFALATFSVTANDHSDPLSGGAHRVIPDICFLSVHPNQYRRHDVRQRTDTYRSIVRYSRKLIRVRATRRSWSARRRRNRYERPHQVDLLTGMRVEFFFPAGTLTQAIQLRSGVRDGGGRRRGLLGFVYSTDRNISAMTILDAQQITEGPIATGWLPQRLPQDFHGRRIYSNNSS